MRLLRCSPLGFALVLGIVLPAVVTVAASCARPEAKAACAVIDLASAGCKILVRLEDGREVELPRETVRGVALARAAASSSPSPKAP